MSTVAHAQLQIDASFLQDSLSQWYDISTTTQWSPRTMNWAVAAEWKDWKALPDKANWADTWLRLPLQNATDKDIDLALLLHYDEWDAWWTVDGRWQQRQGGQLRPKEFWNSQSHQPVFSSPHTLQFSIPAQQEVTLYLQLGRDDTYSYFRPQLMEREAFVAYSVHYFQRTIATQSIVQAALWMMLLYHLFLFFVNRQWAYLAYSIYIFCIASLLFYSFGMHYLTPLAAFPFASRLLLIGMSYAYFAAYAQFLIRFLHDEYWRSDLREWLVRLSRATLLIGVLMMGALSLPIEVFPLSYAYTMLLIVSPIGFALISWISWHYWRSDRQQARLIALTNAFLIVGTVVSTLILLGGQLDWWVLRDTSYWGILFLELTIILHLLSFAVSLSYRGLVVERERIRLSELDALKSRFFASISHEFRTPLTLILGPVQQLKATINDRSARPYLRLIDTYAQQLLQMVNHILDLSKLEAQQLELQPAVFDVAQIGRSTLYAFASKAKERTIDLQFEAEPETQLVYLDPTKTEQILINLIDNAIKYNRDDGFIRVKTTIEEGKWTLRVKDSGQGIAEGELPHIFDLYYRTKSARTDQASSGIGLAWIKQLVEWQEGIIQVESQLGEGSQFTIQIPLPKLPEKEAIAYPNSSLVTTNLAISENTESDQPLLLLVEDHADIRWYLQQCLQADYQLQFAENGRLGLEKATAIVPDLIVTDVMMPEMNGFELVEQLKQATSTSHIPVIILTGKSSDTSKISGLETQADDYLTKPFQATELQLRIRNLLRNRQRWMDKHPSDTTPSTRPTLPSQEEIFLQRARDLVEQNRSDENFGVEQLGAALHLDRTQLFRKLKALTGENPSYFIRSIRLEKARELLQQKTASVAEIAFQVGFQSPSYFSRSFKKHFGQTPGEVLNQQQ